MKDKLTEEQSQEILKALDEALANDVWEKSSFLKAIGKRLHGVRDRLIAQLNLVENENLKVTEHLANRIALHSGKREIFIVLYSSDGSNLQAWERIIANLPKQMISRPIYADEKDAREIIRLKENKANDAYISVYVNQTDILPVSADKMPTDKLGKSLLSLKAKSLNLENIGRFVHQSEVYKYYQARLIKALPGEV